MEYLGTYLIIAAILLAIVFVKKSLVIIPQSETKIIERLGISMTEVAAIGDGWNDVEMLDSVGLGIAMGNAKPEAKAVANHITEHILEEGLPKAVDYILDLNRK